MKILMMVILHGLLIIGLIKPSLVMRWSEKPNRPAIFGLWLVSCLIVAFLFSLSKPKESTPTDRIAVAEHLMAQGKYKVAKNTLLMIKKGELHFEQSKILIDSINNIILTNDSIARVEKKETERRQKAYADSMGTEELKSTILLIDQNFDYSTMHSSMENLRAELIMFASYEATIYKYTDSPNPERNRLAKTLKTKVQNLQAKEFPKMRKAFAKRMAERMWEEDVYVSAIGSGNTIIQLAGGIFVTNRNIKETQDIMHEGLLQYRFKEARYRWYRGADEYTYYKIFEGKDTDPVTFVK